jgi:hypothetical protein
MNKENSLRENDFLVYLADTLANRFLGERLPIDFGDIKAGHKIQKFHLKRIAKTLLAVGGNPSTIYMPPSPLRTLAIGVYEHCVKTFYNYD